MPAIALKNPAAFTVLFIWANVLPYGIPVTDQNQQKSLKRYVVVI
jgi:hypothetical protein